jgi:phage gp45-like
LLHSKSYGMDGSRCKRVSWLSEGCCETMAINVTTKVQINAPQVLTTGLINGDLDITDKAESGGNSMVSMRASYNDHTHLENNAAGGSTNKPNQQV